MNTSLGHNRLGGRQGEWRILFASLLLLLLSGYTVSAQPLPSHLDVPAATISSGTATYGAISSITSANSFVVNGSASVVFEAGSSIDLKPGFHVTAGTSAVTFHALILKTASVILTSSLNPSGPGNAVTFTATTTSSSGIPSGTVTFFDGTTVLAVAALDPTGKAAISNSSLGIGNHSITASFNGGAAWLNNVSGSLVQQVQTQTNTSLSATPSPSLSTQQVQLTATVTASGGSPSGSVNFFDGATSVGTANVDGSGHATLAVGPLSAGAHSLNAVFSGSTGWLGSSSLPVSLSVQDFQLGQPPNVYVTQGGSSTFSISTAAISGFSGGINVTASGAPSGVTVSLSSPVSPGGAISGQITASTAASLGTASIVITASSGPLSHSVTLSPNIIGLPTITSPQISGQGPADTPQSFTFKFTDAAGAQSITGGTISFVNGSSTCNVAFSQTSLTLTDNQQSLSLPASTGSIVNSVCTVFGLGSNVTIDSSGALNATLSVSFSSSTGVGTYSVAYVVSAGGATSSTVNWGQWIVAGSPSVLPSGSYTIWTGFLQYPTFQVFDPRGPSAISIATLTFNMTDASGNTLMDCAAQYLPSATYPFSSYYNLPGPDACDMPQFPYGAAGQSGSYLELTPYLVFGNGTTSGYNLGPPNAKGVYSISAMVVDNDGLTAPVTDLGTLSAVDYSSGGSDFYFSVPSGLSVAPGTNTSGNISPTTTGSYQTSNLLFSSTTPSCPASPLCVSFSGASFTITANASASPGIYNLTFVSTYGPNGPQKAVQVPLTVNLPSPSNSTADFLLSLPNPLSLSKGSAGDTSMTMTTFNGFNSPVALSFSGGGTGISVNSKPGAIFGNSTAALTVSVASSTSPGIYTIFVTGTPVNVSTPSPRTVAFQVVVINTSPKTFSMTAPQTIVWYGPRNQTNCCAVNFLNGFTSPVTVTASFTNPGLGFGIAVNFGGSNVIPPNAPNFSLLITTPGTVVAGTYQIVIKGVAQDGTSNSVTTNLLVTSGYLSLYGVQLQLSKTLVPAQQPVTVPFTGKVKANGSGALDVPAGSSPRVAPEVVGAESVSPAAANVYTLSSSVTPTGPFGGTPGCIDITGLPATVTATSPSFTGTLSVKSTCTRGMYAVTITATNLAGGPGESATAVVVVGLPQKEYIYLNGQKVAIENQ